MMADTRALMTASAALLLLAFALHWPAITRRIPRRAWWLAGGGVLIPLLDPLIAHLMAQDQIGALTRAPLFGGPLPALALIAVAAIGAAIWWGRRAALLALAGLCGGVGLHLALQGLTGWGVPWLTPFSLSRTGWALFPQGQAVLVALLVAALAAMEVARRWDGAARWARWGAAVLGAAYLLGSVGGFLWANVAAPAAGPNTTSRRVSVAGWLPLRWQVVDRTPEAYRVVTLGLSGSSGTPMRIPRWNDEARMLMELQDPLVYRLYCRLFRNPVATFATSSSQTTLTVQELSEHLAGTEGPEFVLKTDSNGRNRLYRLERFD